jgi:hypothetical protein
MTQYTGSGTCVSVSAASPSTHDATGFAALTYTQLGELETVGEINAQHSSANFANLCTGKTSIVKGSEDAIQFDIGVAMDRSDAGQAMMTTARKSQTAKVSLKIVDSAGDTVYVQCYVLSERIAGGAGVNDVRMGNYGLGVIAPSTGDTAVVVLAV